MHLPFLPLCPTAAGTNNNEAGPPDPPVPLSAASAAIQAAFGDAEHAIVKSILAQLTAGNEEGAKEQACNAVINFLIANGLQNAFGVDDEIWTTLLNNVFPGAPTPTPPGAGNAPTPTPPGAGFQMHPAPPLPANARELFFAMCKRHRHARLQEEEYARLTERQTENYFAREKLQQVAEDWIKRTGIEDPAEQRLHRSYRRLQRKLEKLEHNFNRLTSEMEKMYNGELALARKKLTEWNPLLPPPLVRRQNGFRLLWNATSGFWDEDNVPPGDAGDDESDNDDEDENHGINPALFGDDYE